MGVADFVMHHYAWLGGPEATNYLIMNGKK